MILAFTKSTLLRFVAPAKALSPILFKVFGKTMFVIVILSWKAPSPIPTTSLTIPFSKEYVEIWYNRYLELSRQQ